MADKARVAVLRVTPETILSDIERLLELAGVQEALAPGATTILKDNISWHFPFPGANTTPWQLEGTILALRRHGFQEQVCVQNKTVVTNAFKGEDLNHYVPIFRKYDIPVLYNFRDADMRWIEYKPKAKMRVLDRIFPEGIRIPELLRGQEHRALADDEVPHLHDHHGRDEECLRRFAQHQAPLHAQHPFDSRLLQCASDLGGCSENGHGGRDVFFGTNDRNYQRIISYIYSIQGGNNPYDFAFYVRRINPIFDDVNAVQGGALNLSCASSGCHRSRAIGGESDNGSHLSILPVAVLEEELRHNFFIATSLLHFPDPPQSSLFLYPTNEIADTSNDFATGISHPGGLDFSTTSPEAEAILQWAGGLRLDTQGAQRHWLVAGDFAAFGVTSEEIEGEASIQPSIFMASGQSAEFHDGLWDGFFSTSSFIDLNDEAQGFFRTVPVNRIVYAVAYVFNTANQDIRATITVTSPNAVQIFAGGEPIEVAPGQSANVEVVLPARTSNGQRIMIKTFQSTQDSQFGFTATITDNLGGALSNAILVKLEPEGGT